MPCHDSWGSGRSCDGTCNDHEVKRLRERNDELARMLCGSCTEFSKTLDGEPRNRSVVKMIMDKVPGLTEWWKEHQKQDRREEQQEAAKRLAKALKIK